MRKRVLREAAIRIGLPRDLALKTKKSTQYGSGVHRTLTRLAREKCITPRKLLTDIYENFLMKVKEGDFDGAGGISPAIRG